MRLRVRVFGVALGLGLLAGTLPGQVGIARATPIGVCTAVPNTISVHYNIGYSIDFVDATLTFRTPVVTTNYADYYSCGNPTYTGSPSALQSWKKFTWVVQKNASGTISWAYGTAGWLPWNYRVSFQTTIGTYGAVTYSALVTEGTGQAPQLCTWGFGSNRTAYPCNRLASRSGSL